LLDAPARVPARMAAQVSAYLAWRPEWPLVALVAVAWAALAVDHLPADSSPVHHHAMAMPSPSVSAAVSPSWSLSAWALMCVAMMLPLGLPAARHVATNSFRSRRVRATGVFSVAFLAPWVCVGVVALPAAAELEARGVSRPSLAVALLIVAGVWQLTPWKRQAVLSCSRTVPLPPVGLRSDAACAEFGVRQALRCLLACWPLMALMAVTPHTLLGLAVMAAATGVMVAEMRTRSRRRLIPMLAVPMLVTAALVPVLG
jgi:predicted metal-binding membrane protein